MRAYRYLLRCARIRRWPTLPPPARPLLLSWLGVCLGYLLCASAFLWPLPAQFTTHIWGDRFDAWTTLWLMDHLHAHLMAGTLSATTDSILFPVGYNLWSFGHAALQALGVGLMLLGVPLVTAYNTLLVVGLAGSGLGAHVLGRTLHGSHRGGWLAGVVFMTSPYLYGEGAAGCIELVAAGMIPWFAATAVWLVRSPGWRSALLCAASWPSWGRSTGTTRSSPGCWASASWSGSSWWAATAPPPGCSARWRSPLRSTRRWSRWSAGKRLRARRSTSRSCRNPSRGRRRWPSPTASSRSPR